MEKMPKDASSPSCLNTCFCVEESSGLDDSLEDDEDTLRLGFEGSEEEFEAGSAAKEDTEKEFEDSEGGDDDEMGSTTRTVRGCRITGSAPNATRVVDG